MERAPESEDARAAPIVPEDRENAEDVFRPKFGPEITKSISPGKRLCNAILEHEAGVASNKIHSPISPSFKLRGDGEISPCPSASLG